MTTNAWIVMAMVAVFFVAGIIIIIREHIKYLKTDIYFTDEDIRWLNEHGPTREQINEAFGYVDIDDGSDELHQREPLISIRDPRLDLHMYLARRYAWHNRSRSTTTDI